MRTLLKLDTSFFAMKTIFKAREYWTVHKTFESAFTHEHNGQYEEAGSHAHIQHSKNNSGENTAGADRRKEQQQPSKCRDSDETA